VSRIAVLGEAVRVEPFALAGAVVAAADTPDAVCDAWQALGDDVGVVVMSPSAAAALAAAGIAPQGDRLVVTLP